MIPLTIRSNGEPHGTKIDGIEDAELESVIIMLYHDKPGEAIVKMQASDVTCKVSSNLMVFCPHCHAKMEAKHV